MRTDVLSFIMSSENRKKIVKTLFEYPERQWSCSSMEELNKFPHATVYRTLSGLRYFGILKSYKTNKKDVVYELVNESPLVREIKRTLNIERATIKEIIKKFVASIKSKKIQSCILYGSSVREDIKPDSDIDILIILKKHDPQLEKMIFDISGKFSSKFNRTLSVMFMDRIELIKEANSQFINSVKSGMEVVYGKKPF